MNVTEFGNYPNRSARDTHPRRAKQSTSCEQVASFRSRNR